MNGIPEDFPADRPLCELPGTYLTAFVEQLNSYVQRNPNSALATVVLKGHKFVAMSRTPALGHKDGPDNPYPNAAIQSDSLLMMVQVSAGP
jgi:hypothetical protein